MNSHKGILGLLCLFCYAKTSVHGLLFRYAYIQNPLSATEIREKTILSKLILDLSDVPDFKELEGSCYNLTTMKTSLKILKTGTNGGTTNPYQNTSCEEGFRHCGTSRRRRCVKYIFQNVKANRMPTVCPRERRIQINIEWSLATPIRTSMELRTRNGTEFGCVVKKKSKLFIGCRKFKQNFKGKIITVDDMDQTARLTIYGRHRNFTNYYQVFFMKTKIKKIHKQGPWKPKRLSILNDDFLFNISYPRYKKIK